jgi:predicted ATP-grasp superfamily ATP-dependent carboligase
LARILVLDGHSAAALAVTRSAGRSGHWVAVGANGGLFAAAKLSRYCRSTLDYPVSTNDPAAFVQAVLEFVRDQKIELVIPGTDWTLQPLSAERARFEGVCRVALPPAHALELVSDKFKTIERAQNLGVRVPSSQLVSSESDLPIWANNFPVVVKDRFSVRWNTGNAVLGGVTYAYSTNDLKAKITERLAAAGDVLMQEFVAGTGIGFSCFAANGQAYLPFQWERVREVDPRGSASSARKSVPLDAALVAASVKLVMEMEFSGLAMVEYKRTPDGRLVLMEINGRPWGSIGLPIACGIDYPMHLINWCLHGTLPPREIRYRENILCRRAVSEMTHLVNVRAGRPANWPGRYPNFWTSLLAMAVPWRPGMRYDDVWISDLRPGLAGLSNWFRARKKKAQA